MTRATVVSLGAILVLDTALRFHRLDRESLRIDEIFSLDNVVATPHLGGTTVESLDRIATRLAALLKEHLRPDLPRA